MLAHGRYTFGTTHISLERFLRQVFDFRDVIVLIRGAVLNLQSFFVRFAHIRRSLASLDLQRGLLLGFGAVAFVDFLDRFAFQRFFAVSRKLQDLIGSSSLSSFFGCCSVSSSSSSSS